MQKIYLPARVWRRRIVALLRVLCGCLCAADACYRWLAIEDSFLLAGRRLSPAANGWLASWLHVANPHLFAGGVAATEVVIACCLLCGALTNLACSLGILLTLLGCTTTGALAAFLEPGSFDLGILLVALLSFLGLSLAGAGQTYGVEGWLARGRRAEAGVRLVNQRPLSKENVLSGESFLPRESALSDFVMRGSSGCSEVVDVDSAPKKRQRVLFM